MRIAPLFGFVAFAILVTALVGLFGSDEEPATVEAAYRPPVLELTTVTTETTQPTTTVITSPPVDREPDVDALGVPVGELLVTTTTVTLPSEASAKAPSSKPAPPATQPRAVTAPTTTVPPPEAESGPNADVEAGFASKINSFRSDNGLGELSRDGSLDSRARGWAEQMAGNGGLSHSDLGSLLPPWSAAGENVGKGGSVNGLFDALVGSSGHKANMLGDYTNFGVGVWVDSSGTIWTAHVFTR